MGNILRKLVKWVGLGFAVLLVAGAAALLLFGRDSHRNLTGTVPEKIDQYLNEKEFRGVVQINKGGEVLFSKGYGLAAPDVPNAPSTLYQIASLSKSFTAVAIMQLVESQKIGLEDPISNYFPNLPHGESITIGQLLSHSSGIPDYLQSRFNFDYSLAWKPLDIVEVVRESELDFEPGKSFGYSNTGYVLLGLLIEKVSGQPYEDYITEHIFKPSGMQSSMFKASPGALAAQGHINGSVGPVMHPSAAFAAGDIISTAEDLARFDRALRDGKLITKETAKRMETTQASRFPYQYGYGWYTQNVIGLKASGHSGGYPSGFRHYIARLQDEDLTVIVLSNELTVNSKSINRNLTAIALQKPIWIWQKLL